jgi:hypothetical protein
MRHYLTISFILGLTFSCAEKTRTLEYWPNGNKKTEIIVEKGSADNPEDYIFISYHSNGEIFKTGQVLSGKEQGTWQYYFADGEKKSSSEYVNGILDGPFKIFYRNGGLKQEGVYANNRIEQATHYDLNGNHRENKPNAIHPTFEIEPWTSEQVELMIIECITAQSVGYSNTENFCDCIIKSIAIQYPFELYSNLSQAETNLAYDNIMKDNYCNDIRKEKDAR